MVARWYYPLAACALCAGLAAAQLPQFTPPEKSERTVAPPDAKPGTTRLPSAPGLRDLAPGASERVRLAQPLTPIASPEENPRAGFSRSLAQPLTPERNLAPPAQVQRDPSAFRVAPGERGNKLPEAVPGRNLAPVIGERISPPPAGFLNRVPNDLPPVERMPTR